MINLEEGQLLKWRTLIDVISNVRKMVLFANMDEAPMTSQDLEDRLSEKYPDLINPLMQNGIYTCLARVLAKEPTPIVEETLVNGRRPGTNTKAWGLTEYGLMIRPIVAFAIEYHSRLGYLPSDILGEMNTTSQKGMREIYSKVGILIQLAEGYDAHLGDLSMTAGLPIDKLQKKLDDLAGIKKISGDPTPFVEPVSGSRQIQRGVYVSTGKVLAPEEFEPLYRNKRLAELARRFSSSPKGTPFFSRDIEDAGYSSLLTLERALNNPIKKGYVEFSEANEFRRYSITKFGMYYVRNFLDMMMAAFLEAREYVDYIKDNQPSVQAATNLLNRYHQKRSGKVYITETITG